MANKIKSDTSTIIIIVVITLFFSLFIGQYNMPGYGYGMMSWMFGSFGFMWIFGFLFMILLIIALVLLIIWLIKQIQTQGGKK